MLLQFACVYVYVWITLSWVMPEWFSFFFGGGGGADLDFWLFSSKYTYIFSLVNIRISIKRPWSIYLSTTLALPPGDCFSQNYVRYILVYKRIYTLHISQKHYTFWIGSNIELLFFRGFKICFSKHAQFFLCPLKQGPSFTLKQSYIGEKKILN